MSREQTVKATAIAKGRDPDVEWLTTKIGDALAAFKREQPEGPTEHDVVYDTIVADRGDAVEALRRVIALGEGWVGFDSSHHYGDAILTEIGPSLLLLARGSDD